MHRDKDLAGLYGICDKSRRGHLAPARYDLNRLVCADPEPLGVERIELYVHLFGIQFAEYARFSRPGLGVPLGRRAAAGEQSEGIFCVGRLRQFARSFEQESGLTVIVVEKAVLEQASFLRKPGRFHSDTPICGQAVGCLSFRQRPLDAAGLIEHLVIADAGKITGLSARKFS